MNIESAMRTLIKQGTQDSEIKKKLLLRKLRKDAKRGGVTWENKMRTLDDEWMLRLCMANLINGELDYEGWGYRNPRDGLIPNLAPWWDGKPVEKLLVLSEQGVGDSILFASIFKDIPCDDITVECDKRLIPIFERSFPNIKFVGRKHYREGFWGTDDTEIEAMEFDAQVLDGELMTFFRRKKSDFPKEPYLVAEPNEKYKGLVGVSWIGRQGAVDITGDVSLQYGVDDHRGLIVPDIDLKDDFEGIFSIVAALDKVVSVPTTVVHIAGSLGVPVDLWIPKRGMSHSGFDDGKVNNSLNWRFTETGCLWHPSVKIMGVK